MGKVKFTLGNLWFWAAMIFVCFLVENMQYLTGNPMSGYNPSTLIILTVGSLACLFMFFFINHKKNKMGFDWVLLPGLTILAAAFLLAIWLAKGNTYYSDDGALSIEVSFTLYEKIKASIILVVFLIATYGYLFAVNTNMVSFRKVLLIAYIGILATSISIAYSLVKEIDVYKAILKNDPLQTGMQIVSFYGNKNYYGGVLFIGILSCVIVNFYKPRFFWYLLMDFMLVILISTVSVLPTLILVIAVPIYFLVEITRYAVKKKVKECIFALISLLLLLSLIIVFYYGSRHHWKGFVGIDVYITSIYADKDFTTFTNRTILWKKIFPYCTDNPISLIFGHGFILSEKHIMAITGVNNIALKGVRTTHNGLLQTLFEYGIVGVLVNLSLICYFVYSCIRLLLEKKFHFVFIHSFIVACCGVYSICESSSFFDAGVKELYMTVVFLMPVIVRAKMIARPEKIKEIQTLEAEHKVADPVRLGQTAALVLMSFVCVCVSALLCTFTFDNELMNHIVFNALIGLGIVLLFVPYLITLFYKNTDRMTFVVHCVFNGLIILGSCVGLYFVMHKFDNLIDFSKYAVPALLFVLLLLDTLLYTLVKDGSFKEWAKVFFGGCFVIPRYALIAGLVIPGIINIALQTMNMMNWFVYLTNMAFSLVCFYFVFSFLPTKTGKLMGEYYNELDLYNLKRITLMDEVYYG